ncbi:MAG: CPBP family intramembrane glutamic endopeptidase [Candidatus Uhrbacteria bacterium]
MKGFIGWLKCRATGVDALGYAILGFLISITWVVFVMVVLIRILGTGFLESSSTISKHANEPLFACLFFGIMFCASPFEVIFEEYLFRVYFFRRFTKRYKNPHDIVFGIAFGALVFGLAHLPFTFSFTVFLIQGVGGVILGLVYLKTGGWQGKPRHGMFWSWLTHATYNAVVFGTGFALSLSELHH